MGRQATLGWFLAHSVAQRAQHILPPPFTRHACPPTHPPTHQYCPTTALPTSVCPAACLAWWDALVMSSHPLAYPLWGPL